jgi:DNA-binding NtrC family response regulator
MSERPIRVLAVEDSENDFRLAVRLLRRAGFVPDCQRVQDLPTLQQALLEGPWDAVISDFSMPGFSGLEALAEFRKTGLDIPFIFVSGTIGEEMAVAAMQAGARPRPS